MDAGNKFWFKGAGGSKLLGKENKKQSRTFLWGNCASMLHYLSYQISLLSGCSACMLPPLEQDFWFHSSGFCAIGISRLQSLLCNQFCWRTSSLLKLRFILLLHYNGLNLCSEPLRTKRIYIYIITHTAIFRGDYLIMEVSFPLHDNADFNLTKRKKQFRSNVYRTTIL